MADLNISNPISSIIDKVGDIALRFIPDPAQKAQAQLAMFQAQQEGAFKDEENRFNAITTEAKSEDKWTSRARPSFMYVVYTLLLTAIPMGVVYAVNPDTAHQITIGFKEWLSSIPPDLMELFKWVMLGYIGGRTVEKVKGATGK